ncbi:DegT/DnrJ/EryC1/StrS family aminotransferase [Anaerospora sp.]|uniref:DegT/DnrJ/EryC1/StrS family aminotransferase n=1 Tax=Anaerospora sp. TaxID=1960278 RepID=UPI0028971A6B|nr:DegT/DnrJ/EryC1/StrS family aminotransferase [Anaerospora sp.]
MRKVFVNEPKLDGNERKYLNECIDSGWISFEGPFVSRFEEGMAKLTNRKYGIAVSNGSVALDTAVMALELGKDDEVIMPTFTIMSCAAPLVRAGAKPVLVDADPLTWNMRVEDIESKITPKTKAIMVVHIYGLPVDMDKVLELAVKYKLRIIEDAAEMHGQAYKGRPCGSFGDISTFSFYPNKHITCGEGGMVLTNDEKLAERCKLVRNLFFSPEKRYVHEELSYNFRMTNMQAAIGVAQLERIDETVAKKRHIGKMYTELLKGVEVIQLPVAKTDYADNIYWVYGIVLDDELNIDAEVVMNKLASEGIGTRGFFWCMHEQPVFEKMKLFAGESYPHAERLARKGFYLPSGVTITDEQQIYVVEKLKKALSEVKQSGF